MAYEVVPKVDAKVASARGWVEKEVNKIPTNIMSTYLVGAGVSPE